ncbi:hypothetical protein ACHAWF_008942 [Thalassiosira exigua]
MGATFQVVAITVGLSPTPPPSAPATVSVSVRWPWPWRWRCFRRPSAGSTGRGRSWEGRRSVCSRRRGPRGRGEGRRPPPPASASASASRRDRPPRPLRGRGRGATPSPVRRRGSSTPCPLPVRPPSSAGGRSGGAAERPGAAEEAAPARPSGGGKITSTAWRWCRRATWKAIVGRAAPPPPPPPFSTSVSFANVRGSHRAKLRSVCGLLVPPAAREGYFALRAFNAEVAGIKDSSSRPRGGGAGGGGEGGFDGGDPSLASRLRMRWWGDAVAKMYEGAGEGAIAGERNPTLRSLARAVREHDLTRRFLDRMVEAREADLDVARYDGMGDVARYGEDTASSLLYLSLECAGVRDENADAVASDVGVALGILTALRSTAFRAARGESSIPDDVALRHSASMDALRSALEASARGDGTDEQRESASASREAVRSASREMAAAASVRLARARENEHLVPKEGRTTILLPAACGLRCLDSLKEVDYDVFHPSVVGDGGRRLGLMFLLGRTWLTGIF